MDFPLVLTLILFIQGTPGNPPSDALSFLSNVTQRYVDANSYHIEATVEHIASNELSRTWEKTLLKAIAAPGGGIAMRGAPDGAPPFLYLTEPRSGFTTQTSTGTQRRRLQPACQRKVSLARKRKCLP